MIEKRLIAYFLCADPDPEWIENADNMDVLAGVNGQMTSGASLL